jgi:NO-binding membrane sensor protein with MHYT domain
MMDFIQQLRYRNETLFWYGLICLVFSAVCIVLTRYSNTQVYNVNAWYKPFKFAFSTFLFVWAMAWYCYYLPNFNIKLFNWSVIILLGFEIFYIAFQAGKGQLSHYNVSSPLYSGLYSMMALAASIVTLYTAYVGILFFTNSFPELPNYYLWAIRLGIIVFVIFSFEGFAMGSRLNHSVGALNENSNLFILGWSKTVGDLRVSHFIGMHALQVLPVLSYYVLKNTKLTILLSIIYFLLALSTLIQALKGRPLINAKIEETTSQ